MRVAEYWHETEDGRVACDLCPHGCRLREGQTGLCRVRGVRQGKLIARGYGHVSSAHVDPIEKKPLHHFYPGASIFSIGGWGCNLACSFCQNWTISQAAELSGQPHTPEEIVEAAGQGGSIGIAYTYNEPLIGFEFVRDCARLARGRGLVNVLVTNGYIRTEPASELLPLVDALNLDIKSMDDAFYRQHCRGSLEPVLAFACQAVRAGCHVEITNLVIPGFNDRDSDIERLALWMREHLGPAIPLHLSAYHPEYRCEQPPTPPERLLAAREIARRHLHYVFVGNIWGRAGQNTECPECGAVLIEREGYRTRVTGIQDGRCRKCKRKVDVVGLNALGA